MRTLEDGVHNPLLIRLRSELGEIAWHGLINLDQGGLFVDYVEFMLVGDLVVASSQLANGLVVLIKEGDVAMAVSIERVVICDRLVRDGDGKFNATH